MKLPSLLIAMLISFNCLAQSHELLNRSLSNHLSREINGYIEAEEDDNGVYITHIAPPSFYDLEMVIMKVNYLINDLDVTILSTWKRDGKHYSMMFLAEKKYTVSIGYFPASNRIVVLSTDK